jgi:hypothetical protein
MSSSVIMPSHAGIWPLPLVGTHELEVRCRAGRQQAFAVTLRAMLRVDLAAGVGCGLAASWRDVGKHRGADEEANAQDIRHANGCS